MTKYNIKVEDFIEIKENKSSFDINDMIHICKRKNNSKREYLFVNKYQGKHIPTNPLEIRRLYLEFSNEILKNISKTEKILVIGFAETATALGHHVSIELHKYGYDIACYLQTTREKIKECYEIINFEEEHSHATTQKLYCLNDNLEYDRILFIEDEITTGNTIINFINEFNKKNINTKYTVASILNWQNKENQEKYKNLHIDTICLIKGEIKNAIPSLNINENEFTDLFSPIQSLQENKLEKNNPRLGIFKESFNININDEIQKLLNSINPTDVIEVIGTEEFMYYPLFISYLISLKAKETTFRATTRSPVSASLDEGYAIKKSYQIPSAYSNERKTYIYNSSKPNKVVVISEGKITKDFKDAMEKIYGDIVIFLRYEYI